MTEDGRPSDRGPVDRILAESGHPVLLDVLTRLPGSDLTSLLLEVMRRRADGLSPADVLRRYERDRFVTPAATPREELQRVEAAAFGALPDGVDTLVLAPLVPFATHRALGPVDQNKVVSTARGTEVAADPTNALALEAASRRRRLLRDQPRSPAVVRLAASQRVTRAQRFEGAGVYPHFQLFGFVTAGRDTGGLEFEREAAVEHLAAGVGACAAAGVDAVEVELTDFSGGAFAALLEAVAERFAGTDHVEVAERPDRPRGEGYYDRFCFKVNARFGGHTLEIGDGGLVDWTRSLLADRKERCMISGLGLDRLAAPQVDA